MIAAFGDAELRQRGWERQAMMIDWGTVPAWGASIVATGAAMIAVRQLWNTVHIARANLLLTIDGAYEKPEFLKSRKAVRSLRNRAEKAVKAAPPKNGSSDGLKDAICVECSVQLDSLWEAACKFVDIDVEDANSAGRIASDRYAELMSLPYWFETVGMLCKRNLLPLDDILNLYDQVIITTMSSFANHISRRGDEMPYHNKRFLENAVWLYAEAVKYKKKRDDPTPDRPLISRLKWS